MIRTELETDRLKLRLFTDADVQITYELGTEAARACVEFARQDLGFKMLVALIIPENTASIRIAQKLGMTRGLLIHIYGVDAYQYQMML